MSRTNGRLPRVEQVAMISPWQARGSQHRVGGEQRPGGFGTAADSEARDPSRAGRAGAPLRLLSADAVALPMAGSIRFLAQVIGQDSGGDAPRPLGGHRDGPSLGSQAYRRAGADPALYSEDSALVRFAA